MIEAAANVLLVIICVAGTIAVLTAIADALGWLERWQAWRTLKRTQRMRRWMRKQTMSAPDRSCDRTLPS